MKDPRLVEIEFLSHLDRQGIWSGQPRSGATETFFGMNVVQFREMVFELLQSGDLNGPADILRQENLAYTPGRALSVLAATANQEHLLNLATGRPIELRLNHQGRIRLARLSDELLASRAREQLGVLWDRRALDRALPLALLNASDKEPLSVMMLDLDHFKEANDTHGHQAGDALLRAAFTVVRDLTDDRGYRYGGEEFVGLLPATPFDRAGRIAEAAREAIEKTAGKDAGIDHAQTVSIGLLTLIEPCAYESVVKRVDELMYAAKHAGRNRVVPEQWSPAPT